MTKTPSDIAQRPLGGQIAVGSAGDEKPLGSFQKDLGPAIVTASPQLLWKIKGAGTRVKTFKKIKTELLEPLKNIKGGKPQL